MDLGLIYINQSLITQFLNKGDNIDHCPAYVYAVSIAKTHSFSTEPMMGGNYFETGCIGGCANGTGVYDLPRKRLLKKQVDENRLAALKGLPPIHIGEKRVDQQRIDTRIAYFHQKKNEYGLILNESNCQTFVLKRHPEYSDLILKITMDIFPAFMVIDNNPMLFAMDLKLTKGIDYNWHPDKVKNDRDHIQMQMYHEMIHGIDLELNPHLRNIIDKNIVSLIENNKYVCAYWVWDYKDDDEVKERVIPYRWDRTRRAELYESIRKTYNFVKHYNEHGWTTNPAYERCHRCPKTREECPAKICVQII